MSANNSWRPVPPRPESVQRINQICAEFENTLNKANDLRTETWAGQIQTYVAEIRESFPDDSDSSQYALFALVAQLLECQLRADPATTRYPAAFEPFFSDQMSIIEAVHRHVYDELPETIDRYMILDQLGKGSFGTVYLAYDPNAENPVALKTFSPDVDIARIRSGFQHALPLHHDGIVAVNDLNEDREHGWFLTMQYVNGRSMSDTYGGDVQQGHWPAPREAAALMLKIAEAVQYAHGKGILHRDLKPANVLIDGKGQPHIADFDLAIHEFNQSKHVGEFAGSLPYMAPEQLRGKPIDEKTDAWALGVILYELLAHERPFRGENQQQLVHAIEQADVRVPQEAHAGVPEQLWNACLGCLDKSQARRHSVKRLRDDLERFLHPPPPPPVLTWPPPVLTWLAVVVLGAVTVFGINEMFFSQDSSGPSAPEGRGVPPAPQAETDASQPPLRLAVFNNGQALNVPGASPVRNNNKVYIEVTAQEPMTFYLLWIDSRGKITLLHPWNTGAIEEEDIAAKPPEQLPKERVRSPLKDTWLMVGESGVEAIIALATRQPLSDLDISQIAHQYPLGEVSDPKQLTVLGFDSAQDVFAIDPKTGRDRGPGARTAPIEQPLWQLMQQLSEHFEMGRAVQFAHRKE